MKKLFSTLTKNPIYQKYQFIILPVFSLLFSLLLTLFVTVPRFLEFFNNNQILTDANSSYTVLSQKADTLSKIDSEKYKNNIKVSYVALPLEQDVPSALSQIIFLLNSNKLQLSGISVGGFTGEPSTTSSSKYQVKLDVAGDAISLKKFIANLKESPRIMKVTAIEIAQERASGKVQASMALEVYYQGLPTSIGAVDQPVSKLSPEEEAIIAKINEYTQKVPALSGTAGARGKKDPFQ